VLKTLDKKGKNAFKTFLSTLSKFQTLRIRLRYRRRPTITVTQS